MSEHDRYTRLAKMSQLINSKLDLHDVLEAVVTVISEEVFYCNSVGIYLPESEGVFRGYVSKPAQMNGLTIDQLVIDPRTDQLTKEIIETKTTIYIRDTFEDRRPDRKVVEMFQIKSLLGLPIYFEQEIYGIVFLFDYGTPMNLSTEQIEAIEAYVNMAAVAIRNGKQFEHNKTLLSEKQMLIELTRELALCSYSQEVLDICFRYIGELLSNKNIGVHLCDTIGGSFRPAKLNHQSEWTEADWRKTHKRIQLDYKKDVLFQEVITTQRCIFIPDIEQDPRPNHEACKQFGIKGLFMLPLVAAGEVLGTIAVVSLGEIRYYKDFEMRLTQSIVDATATALSNTLRMEQLEQMVDLRTQELKENHRILELILNSAGEGIYGLDLEGRITFSNSMAADLLGYDADELKGMSQANVLVYSDSLPLSSHPAGEPLVNDPSLKERIFRKKDGTEIPVEYTSTSIIEDQSVIGEVIVFKDITERKRADELLRKTDKLSVVGELAAGVAHEIRNPLTTLRGYVQLIKKECSLKQHAEKMDIMISELDRINFFVSELLFLAKPMEIKYQAHDINHILEHVITLLESQAIMNDVEIKRMVNETPLYVTCAEGQLKQAFINIVKNAIESMPAGGSLIIDTVMASSDTINIRFTDQGCGISSERIAKLGEPFFTTKEKGFGLGLMVTFQIIKQHQGNIEFQSDGKKGTTVEVTLPLAVEAIPTFPKV